jgi:hypothetical protein
MMKLLNLNHLILIHNLYYIIMEKEIIIKYLEQDLKKINQRKNINYKVLNNICKSLYNLS